MKTEKIRPIIFYELLLFAVAFVWGFSFIWTKQITDAGMQGSAFLAIRYTIAAVAMLPFCIKVLRGISKSHLLKCLSIGLFLYGGICAQTAGIVYTTPSNSAFITTTYVIMVPFVAWMVLKQKPNWRIYLSAGVCLAGLYVLTVSPGEGLSLNIGNAITVVSAIFYAFQVVYIAACAKDIHPLAITFIPIACVAIISSVVALFSGAFDLSAVNMSIALPPIIMCALFASILACALQAVAQKHVPPQRVALICSLESVFACIISVVIGLDPFSINLVIGGILVVGAVILSQIVSQKKEESSGEQQE